MKIFAIQNEKDLPKRDLAYLFYYEREKEFYIELPEDADPWDTPLILSSFASKGKWTVDSKWSHEWVRQRIIPYERQNIGRVLKDNKLKEYDEFALLMKGNGRCAQDDCFIKETEFDRLPHDIQERLNGGVTDTLPLDGTKMLVFFGNDEVKEYDFTGYFSEHKRFDVLLKHPDLFVNVKVLPGGRGLSWDCNLELLLYEFLDAGEKLPLRLEFFTEYLKRNTVNTAEAQELLHCSRQYISEMVKAGKLAPVKSSDKSTLFLKRDILELLDR